MDDNKVTYFGQTDARNKKVPFGIKRKDRSKHTYVIGKTGMGKSTLLENMAIQDIKNGEGLAFIDPHGKTAELLLEYIPEERVKDVLYFAPFDMEYPISFNVMEDVGPDKRHLVANGLMSTFEKIWVDAWSARMAYILNNTILALLEYPGSTLLSVNRMLADKDYRKKVVENVTDPSVKSFWIDEFGKYTERFAQEATPAIQNKVGQFTSNPLIRNLIGQPKSTFNIRQLMDERKILIINLSKGRVGEGNANLIGSMLITKIYLAAMSRADANPGELKKLPHFYLYVDEFQSFANRSFANILSEARKYKLNLTIAHQYIEQMEEEVRAAVFGNVGTMISFRVGAYDAEVLEKEFAPKFTAEDLVNLGMYQIYLKLMIDDVTSLPFSASTLPPISLPPRKYVDEVIASSRASFARPRAQVEEEIRLWHQTSRTDTKPPTTPRQLIEQQKEMKAVGPGKLPQNKDVVIEEVPVAPESPEKKMSLGDLKPGVTDKNKKQPSAQNVSALRQALASIMKDIPASPSSETKEVKEKPAAATPAPAPVGAAASTAASISAAAPKPQTPPHIPPQPRPAAAPAPQSQQPQSQSPRPQHTPPREPHREQHHQHKQEHKPEPKPAAPHTVHSGASQASSQPKTDTQPAEVPEEILKKVLEVDQNK